MINKNFKIFLFFLIVFFNLNFFDIISRNFLKNCDIGNSFKNSIKKYPSIIFAEIIEGFFEFKFKDSEKKFTNNLIKLSYELSDILEDRAFKCETIKNNNSIIFYGLSVGFINILLDKNLENFKKILKKTKIKSDISINFLSIFSTMIISNLIKNYSNDLYLSKQNIDFNDEKLKKLNKINIDIIGSISSSIECLFLSYQTFKDFKN